MSSFTVATLGRPNQETMAMTFFELEAPRTLNSNSFLTKVVAWPGEAIRNMQYGRMVHALTTLSDAQLAAIGQTRADIPHYARECLQAKNV